MRPNTQLFYQNDRLSTEIHPAFQRTIVQHGDQLLAQLQGGSGSATCSALATDQQRSTLRVVGDHPPSSFAYTPYGQRPTGSGVNSMLCFSGERPDPLTGHYLLGNGYRSFDPVTMRFGSPDTLSPFGQGGLNAYAYCAGDPINHIDPDGHALTPVARLPKRPLGNFQPLAGTPGTLEKIASFLPAADLANFSQVSTTTHSIARAVLRKRLGNLFALRDNQGLLNKIARLLPGDDLVSFALASSETKAIADRIQTPLALTVTADQIPSKVIRHLRQIALGQALGQYPAKVLKYQNIRDMASQKVSTEDTPMALLDRVAFVRQLHARRNARTQR